MHRSPSFSKGGAVSTLKRDMDIVLNVQSKCVFNFNYYFKREEIQNRSMLHSSVLFFCKSGYFHKTSLQ